MAVQHGEKRTEPARIVETRDLRAECRLLLRSAAPVVATNLVAFSIVGALIRSRLTMQVLFNNLSVGRLGTLELAAVSLANLTSWITGAMVLRASGYALDTLCTQAYGAHPKMCSTLAMRTGLVMLSILPFQIAFAWHSERTFLALGQDPEVAHLSARYFARLSLSLPGYGLFEVLRCWLQAQGLMHVPTAITCTVAPLSLFCSWLLVHSPLSIGFLGGAWTIVFAYWTMGLTLLAYTWRFAPRHAYGGLTPDVFRDLGPNAWLALVGIATGMADTLVWEAAGLVAGVLGRDVLAVQNILIMTISVLWQPFQGVGVAAAARIGNCLGAGRPDLAHQAFRAALMVVTPIGVLVCATLAALLRDVTPRLFSSDPAVLDMASKQMLAAAVFPIMDGIAATTMGVMRGLGRAPRSALVMGLSNWLFGAPVTLILVFGLKLGAPGLWAGMCIGVWTTSAILYHAAMQTDFDDAARQAARSTGVASSDEQLEALLPVSHDA